MILYKSWFESFLWTITPIYRTTFLIPLWFPFMSPFFSIQILNCFASGFIYDLQSRCSLLTDPTDGLKTEDIRTRTSTSVLLVVRVPCLCADNVSEYPRLYGKTVSPPIWGSRSQGTVVEPPPAPPSVQSVKVVFLPSTSDATLT